LDQTVQGKSTLLKLISKELLPTSGRILFMDEDISAFSEEDWKLIFRK